MVLDDCDLEDKTVEDFISSLVTELAEAVESKSSGTVVILTSSTGAKTINRVAAKHLRSGASLDQLQPAALLEDLQEEAGLSWLLRLRKVRRVTTHLVPFLPLSRATVRSCLARLASEQAVKLSSQQVEAVLDMQQVMVAGNTEIVSSGCKQVVSKMDLVRGAVPEREL